MKKKSSYLPNDVVDYIALGTLSNVVIQVARWEIVRGTFFICMVVCLLEAMQMNGITKFILIGENVLNFHVSDDCYYEEWFEDVQDQGGWVAMINFRDHIIDEMRKARLSNYLLMGERLNDLNWRAVKPFHMHHLVEGRLMQALG